MAIKTETLVTFTVLGRTVYAHYVKPITVNTKYPQGGHRVRPVNTTTTVAVRTVAIVPTDDPAQTQFAGR